jgi:hypothetical protein
VRQEKVYKREKKMCGHRYKRSLMEEEGSRKEYLS